VVAELLVLYFSSTQRKVEITLFSIPIPNPNPTLNANYAMCLKYEGRDRYE